MTNLTIFIIFVIQPKILFSSFPIAKITEKATVNQIPNTSTQENYSGMSSKRRNLGFDDDSDEEIPITERNVRTKRVNLPKLRFTRSTEDETSTQIKTTSEEEDQHATGDYLEMVIEEDERSKPQKLQGRDGKPPTGFDYDNIRDTPKQTIKTSLFGQLDPDSKDELVALPNAPLKTKSKGLSIMEKMGFKIGETLGKDSNSASALLEPIITIQPNSRAGISESKPEEEEFIPNRGITVEDASNFRARLNEEQYERKLEKTYHKMERYCYELSGDADDDVEKLNPLDINVLWRSYVKFVQNLLREKRQKQLEQSQLVELEVEEPEDEDEEVDEELALFDELDLSEKVERLNLHLRSEYNYCYYCGVKYEDQQDLFEHCPGQIEEEHN